MKNLPPSLSTWSLQSTSILTEQSSPSQPSSQSHDHSLSSSRPKLPPPPPPATQPPWPEHCPGQPSRVQCRPFQPVTQRQGPFLHCAFRGRHRLSEIVSTQIRIMFAWTAAGDDDCVPVRASSTSGRRRGHGRKAPPSRPRRRRRCSRSGRARRSPCCTRAPCNRRQSSHVRRRT